MKRYISLSAAAFVGAIAGSALAQPAITSLGSGVPNSIARQGGTVIIGGSGLSGTSAARWTYSGGSLSAASIPGTISGGLLSSDGAFSTAGVLNDVPRIFGNTATGVTPPFSPTPTLVPSATDPAATEGCGARWINSSSTLQRMGGLPITPDLLVFGSGSSGSGSGNFISPNAISSNGRFIVGLGYISTYNNAAGATITASNFQWRPFLWDADANGGAGGHTVLPTPFRTSSNTWRRRTGNPYAVSADGLVIVGAQEHNSSVGPSADPDGGRLVTWRWNGSAYVMSYLPNGVDTNGFPITISSTPGTVLMNSTGTIIVGRAINNASETFVGKWVWNSGSSTWDAPINLGADLATPATWLPIAVTSCGIPPTLTPTGMSEDGSIVVGMAVYSTCGSFMSGGFIQIGNGPAQDWYDYLNAASTPGLFTGYGPIGELGDPNVGLPKLGFPTAISADGNIIAGYQGGTQRIPGATPWIVELTGGTPCVAPTITLNPSNVSFSRCSVGSTLSTVILNASAAGTGPFTFQWNKGGSPLADGLTPTGSTITGADSFQMRITKPGPNDAGNYTCVITGCNGLTATTTAAVVAPDPAMVAPANDICSGAQDMGEGTANFNICGAYVDDGFTSCSATELADVWFRYTPTFTGIARLQTCGSSFDTTLQVMLNCGEAPSACNNDVTSRGIVGTSCGATRSLLDYPVTSGQPIYIRVGALSTPFTNSPTSGALTISQAPAAPANDFCSNAFPLGLGVWNTPASNFNFAEATDDYNIGVDFCNGGTASASNRDVWFRLVSPCGGTYTISTCGSTNTNPMLHVFSTCSSNVIACNDNVGSGVAGCTSNQARITDLAIGGDVLIRVSSSGTNAPTSGAFQLNITGTPTICCGTADFNGDGDVGTDADIEAFFACLAGSCCPTCYAGGADFNGDGDVGTDADIEAFFRVLAGSPC